MAGPLGDEHHLLARYRRDQEHARILAREVRRAFDDGQPIVRPVPGRDPVDAIRLRGVPVVGPGSAGGAIRGTRPDIAVLRLDE